MYILPTNINVIQYQIGFYMSINRWRILKGFNKTMIWILKTYSLMVVRLLSMLPLPNSLLYELQKLNNYNIEKYNIGDGLPVQLSAHHVCFNLISSGDQTTTEDSAIESASSNSKCDIIALDVNHKSLLQIAKDKSLHKLFRYQCSEISLLVIYLIYLSFTFKCNILLPNKRNQMLCYKLSDSTFTTDAQRQSLCIYSNKGLLIEYIIHCPILCMKQQLQLRRH